MRRGDVVWVNFEPSVGGEIRKRRPAVVVSNDAANRYLNRIQVVPLSSQTVKLYPSEAYVVVRGKQCKAMADQIATVSKQRLGQRLGTIARPELAQVERAIRIQLGMEMIEE
jgi:mRNA interferase MazF